MKWKFWRARADKRPAEQRFVLAHDFIQGAFDSEELIAIERTLLQRADRDLALGRGLRLIQLRRGKDVVFQADDICTIKAQCAFEMIGDIKNAEIVLRSRDAGSGPVLSQLRRRNPTVESKANVDKAMASAVIPAYSVASKDADNVNLQATTEQFETLLQTEALISKRDQLVRACQLLQHSVPFHFSAEHAAAALSSKVPSADMVRDMRLPCEAGDAVTVFFDRPFDIPAEIAEGTSFYTNGVEHSKILGFVIPADENRRPRESVIILQLKTPRDNSKPFLRADGISLNLNEPLRPLVMNLATVAAWGAWDKPEPLELPEKASDVKEFLRKFRMRSAEGKASALGVHVVDVKEWERRSTPNRKTQGDPYVQAHWRRGHPHRFVIGRRFALIKQYRTHWIPPIHINKALANTAKATVWKLPLIPEVLDAIRNVKPDTSPGRAQKKSRSSDPALEAQVPDLRSDDKEHSSHTRTVTASADTIERHDDPVTTRTWRGSIRIDGADRTNIDFSM